MRNIHYIAVIAALLATSLFFWHRSVELSGRLALIAERIERSKLPPAEPPSEKQEKTYREGPVKAPPGARIAIVLDDWGYNVNNLKAALELEAPLTFSILPNLRYSRRIASAAYEDGNEVILHLPLEPYEDLPLEKDTIIGDMPDEKIAEVLDKAVESVPHLKGVSNHMGSKATEDERIMSAVFTWMNSGGLYFLDSLVTNKSLCRRLSGTLGVKFANRSVFLDNKADPQYIKGQMEELIGQALATGWAIGVGHDRAATIVVLKEVLPLLAERGVAVVPASELAK